MHTAYVWNFFVWHCDISILMRLEVASFLKTSIVFVKNATMLTEIVSDDFTISLDDDDDDDNDDSIADKIPRAVRTGSNSSLYFFRLASLSPL